MAVNPFEQNAAQYDQWFDTERGAHLFERELSCLRPAIALKSGKWLEVGVGPGRFAKHLGIDHGIDISPAMVALSRSRGIDAQVASGNRIPFPDAAFDGVAMICTLCFLENPDEVLKECGRILKGDGLLAIGYIPADSPYGVYNALRGNKSHTYYTGARFYTASQIAEMAERNGFTVTAQNGCELPPVPIADSENVGTKESFVVAILQAAR